jgi:hypothetical protein
MKDLLVLKNQWQAQPVAQPTPEVVEAALPEVVSVLGLAGATGAAVVPDPPLKSVAYQPEPLS